LSRTIKELLVKDGKANDTADKVEVFEVVGIDARVWVNLEGVVVVRRVLEQTVTSKKKTETKNKNISNKRSFRYIPIDWIKHLVRQEEEPLTLHATIVETVFSRKLDVDALLEILDLCTPHDLLERLLKEVLSRQIENERLASHKAHD